MLGRKPNNDRGMLDTASRIVDNPWCRDPCASPVPGHSAFRGSMMPTRPAGPCRSPLCPNLRPCPNHELDLRRANDARRPSARQRGYTAEWERTRRAYLADHPLCECDQTCCPGGCSDIAEDVHHLDGLGPLGPRGHDPANLAGLSHRCHARVTAMGQRTPR